MKAVSPKKNKTTEKNWSCPRSKGVVCKAMKKKEKKKVRNEAKMKKDIYMLGGTPLSCFGARRRHSVFCRFEHRIKSPSTSLQDSKVWHILDKF